MSASASRSPCAPVMAAATTRPGSGLVVGRDPADTTWLVVRYAEDWDPDGWTHARMDGVVFDPGRGVLELATLPPASLHGGGATSAPLPATEIRAPDGTVYRSAPTRDQVLQRPPGAVDFTPLPCFGGRGHALGRLSRPQGLAWDPRGYLLVADAGNHRLQVVRPRDGSVVVALGQRDPWGEFCAGMEGGAMNEPVDVAQDPCTCHIYVADRRAGRIHVFDSSFSHCFSFAPEPSQGWPAGQRPAPVAIAVGAEGTLLIADAGWPRLIQADTQGNPLADVSLRDADHPRFAGLRLATFFVPEGSAVLGPLDSGIHGVAWHDVRVEAQVPDGAAIEIQSWASDDLTAIPSDEHWAPAVPVPIDARDATSDGYEYVRLVQSDWRRWQDWLEGDRLDPAPQGSDCGRYLWLRLRLTGLRRNPAEARAMNTPSLSGLRLRYPRPSWLHYLPGHWSRRDDTTDPSGALFVERFLALFEHVLTDLEIRFEEMPRLLDYTAAPGEWLAWIASWLDLSFDPSWPLDKRRRLLGEAVALYRRRGTPAGLARYIEIYTGRRPEIVEAFALRPGSAVYTLGDDALGCIPLTPESDASASRADNHPGAHHFTLYAYLDDSDDDGVAASVVHRIVDRERPAHTSYDLRIVSPDARVGIQSRVGLDLVLGHGLNTDATLGGTAPAPRLGSGPPLSATGADRECHSPRIDHTGLPVDGTLRLT